MSERPSQVHEFDQIVRTLGKEHLGLKAQIVPSRIATIQAVVVSGSARSAGYACGRSWPWQFRHDLAAGYFG